MPRFQLDPLFNAKSVAVIGASRRGSGRNALENLREVGFKGKVFPINPNYSELDGLTCYPNLEAVDDSVDVAFIAVPAVHVPGILNQAVEKGIKGAVIHSAGFAEASVAGDRLQKQIASLALAHKLPIVGPNCLGVLRSDPPLALYSASMPRNFLSGSVGVLSQSGSACIAIINSDRHLSFSSVVSSGNEMVLDTADYLNFFADDPATRVVVAFLEGVRRPDAFLRAVDRLNAVRKPLILLKTGRSEPGRQAALAHSGAVAGSYRVFEAVCRNRGIILVNDFNELLEAAVLFSRSTKKPKSTGVGLMAASGGFLGMDADLGSDVGIKFPPLSTRTTEDLHQITSSSGGIVSDDVPVNPFDAAGGIYDPGRYTEFLRILGKDPNLGIVLVGQDFPLGMGDSQANRYRSVVSAIIEGAAEVEIPVVLFTHASGGNDPAIWNDLRESGLPVLQGARAAMRAVSSFIKYHLDFPSKKPEQSSSVAVGLVDESQNGVLNESAGKALLRKYGIPVTEPVRVNDADDAVAVANSLGWPVVMKIQSTSILHKNRVGGVRLDILSDREVRSAFSELNQIIEQEAKGNGSVIMEKQVRGGVEIMVGLHRDDDFGITLVCGPGGTQVEELKPLISLALPPLDRSSALVFISENTYLSGALTEQSKETLADVMVSLSMLAHDNDDRLLSVDVNPLIIDNVSGEATAVDALVVLSDH